jgi:hypothetical protein
MSTHASSTRLRSRSVPKTKPMSAAQRKKLATQQLLNTLTGENESTATTAALEVINELLASDRSVQQRLQEKYDELTALTNGRPQPRAGQTAVPKPIAGVDLDRYSPYGKLDPYQLLAGFGRDQLRAVLKGATPPLLREAVDVVQAREPNAGKVNRAKKADMIDYIVEHVAGPGY